MSGYPEKDSIKRVSMYFCTVCPHQLISVIWTTLYLCRFSESCFWFCTVLPLMCWVTWPRQQLVSCSQSKQTIFHNETFKTQCDNIYIWSNNMGQTLISFLIIVNEYHAPTRIKTLKTRLFFTNINVKNHSTMHIQVNSVLTQWMNEISRNISTTYKCYKYV